MKIEAGSLAELNQWIPAWLSSLSLARGQIVVDQIRGTLERSTQCNGFEVPRTGHLCPLPLVFLTSTDSDGQRFAVMAAQSFSVASGHLGADDNDSQIQSDDKSLVKNPSKGRSKGPSKRRNRGMLGDSATILHAGPWVDASCKTSMDSLQIPQPLVDALNETLAKQGVRFLQWATDVGNDSDASLSQICHSFGMCPLATLEYMSVAQDQLTLDKLDRKETLSAHQPLDLVRVDNTHPVWNSDTFESLVSHTYQDTLDCPELSKYRTASQTLQSYQNVDSYDPSRWYFVVSRDDRSTAIGCVMMATHRDHSGKPNGEGKRAPTSELVYMALVPEKRGKGLGRPLVQLALSEPTTRFAPTLNDGSLSDSSLSSDSLSTGSNSEETRSPQIVLAVDQQNTRARELYFDAGLRPLLLEKVWGKSVGDTLSTTT